MRLLRNLAFLLLVTVCWLVAGHNRLNASSAYCYWSGDNLLLDFDTGPSGLCQSLDDANGGVEVCDTTDEPCATLCRETDGCGYDENNFAGSCGDYQGCGDLWEVYGTCTCYLGEGH